jgi:hypothetical protein
MNGINIKIKWNKIWGNINRKVMNFKKKLKVYKQKFRKERPCWSITSRKGVNKGRKIS